MTEPEVRSGGRIRGHCSEYAAVVLVVLVYCVLRIYAGYDYVTVDEEIPIRVIEQIQRSGSWDTNWALTGLPEYFRYDQYNFSSYIITCAVAFKALLLLDNHFDILFFLRVVSALCHAAAVVLTYLLGKSLLGTCWGAAVAGAAVAFFPLLFQDSLYARPESFSTAVTVLMLILMEKALRARTPGWVAGAGVVAGFLIACKITFVAILALSALLLLFQGAGWPVRLRNLALLFAAAAAGFVAGAPHAVANVPAYLNGINELLTQYSGGQPPHGLADATTLQRLGHGWQYFVSTGSLFFLPLAAAGVLIFIRERRYTVVLSCLLFLALLLYFCGKPVFFERNFSFTIPLLAISAVRVIAAGSAAVSGKWVGRLVAAGGSTLLLAGPFLFLLYLGENVFNNTLQEQRKTVHGRLLAVNVPVKVFGYLLDEASFQNLKAKAAREAPGTVHEIWGANDVYTERFLKKAEALLGMKRLTEIRSPLQEKGVPASTLYTYHAPHYILLVQTR